MEYGIEMWGPGYLSNTAAQNGNDPAEILQYLRRLLGVRANTPNMVICSELGKYPLRYHWRKRIYAYYQRLALLAAQGHRFILAAALRDNMQLAAAQQTAGIEASQQAWMGKVAAYLGKCGIPIDLSATAAAAVPTIPPREVEESGQQQHLQQLTAANGSKITFYKQHIRVWNETAAINRSEYSIQPHLETAMPWRRRRELSRFRTSSHFLRVEMDRYLPHHPAHNTRTCRLCNTGADISSGHSSTYYSKGSGGGAPPTLTKI